MPDHGREQDYYRDAPTMGAENYNYGSAAGVNGEDPQYGRGWENRNYDRDIGTDRGKAGYGYEQGYGREPGYDREKSTYGYDPRYADESGYVQPSQGYGRDPGIGRGSLGSEMASAPKDDLFETGKWRTFEDPDETRAFAPPPRRESAPPPQWQPPSPQRQAQMRQQEQARRQQNGEDARYSSGSRGMPMRLRNREADAEAKAPTQVKSVLSWPEYACSLC